MNSNTGNNFIFFGSPKFAEIILNNLIKSDFEPHLIVSSPDRSLGRKQIITPPPAKILAEKKEALHKDEIVKEVLLQRLVAKNTVLMNLNNKKYFQKNEEGKYS